MALADESFKRAVVATAHDTVRPSGYIIGNIARIGAEAMLLLKLTPGAVAAAEMPGLVLVGKYSQPAQKLLPYGKCCDSQTV